MDKETLFIDKLKDPSYREIILDSLCHGNSDLRDILIWIIEYKLILFDNDLFEDVSLQELVLPTTRRVWSMIFLEPPSIFKSHDYTNKIVSKNLEDSNKKRNKRLELFKLSFNKEEFIDYLLKMIKDNKDSLNGFEYLDKPLQLVTLVSDNYIAKLVEQVNNSENLDQDIRDNKLNKLIK